MADTNPADTVHTVDDDERDRPFFPQPCNTGADWDVVGKLTDDELDELVRRLHDLADDYPDGSTVQRYVHLLALHPGAERNHRAVLLCRAEAELCDGHRAVAIPTDPRRGVWAAQCGCDWEGPERRSEDQAAVDAEAHVAPFVPAGWTL